MRVLLIAAFLTLTSISANATPLSPGDVKTLLSMIGLNPGTVRALGKRGLHQLVNVRVTGRHGHWIVRIVEREVHPANWKR